MVATYTDVDPVTGARITVPVTPLKPLPVTGSGGGGGSSSPFAVTGNTTLAVTTASARVALPNTDASLLIQNTGSVDAYVKLGNASVTAATTDTLVAAGTKLVLATGTAVDLAAITAAGSTTLAITQGTGTPAGWGGGGGAAGTSSDTRTAAANITAADVGTAATVGQSGVSLVTGTPTANSFQTFALNGQSAGALTVTGTFVATAKIEASFDVGLTYVPVSGLLRGTSLTTSTITAPGIFSVDLTGATYLRVRAPAYTSGTMAVALTVSPASGMTKVLNGLHIVDSAAAEVDWAAVVPVSQSGVFTVQPGNTANTTPWLVTTSSTAKVAYSASITGLVPAAAATDIFTLIGSATKTIRVTRIQISGVATAAAAVDVQIIKRSTAGSGGTSTSPTMVPNDSLDGAATALAKAFTANPTVGTIVGLIRSQKITLTTGAGAIPLVQTLIEFGTNFARAITLRGAAEQIAINWNAQTVTGNSVNIDIEWTEE